MLSRCPDGWTDRARIKVPVGGQVIITFLDMIMINIQVNKQDWTCKTTVLCIVRMEINKTLKLAMLQNSDLLQPTIVRGASCHRLYITYFTFNMDHFVMIKLQRALWSPVRTPMCPLQTIYGVL